EVGHMFPPAFANLGLGDGLPARFVLDLGVGEELTRFGVEVDGVVVHAVGAENLGEFFPDRLVAAGVFRLLSGVDGHDEGFADHRWSVSGAGELVGEGMREASGGRCRWRIWIIRLSPAARDAGLCWRSRRSMLPLLFRQHA